MGRIASFRKKLTPLAVIGAVAMTLASCGDSGGSSGGDSGSFSKSQQQSIENIVRNYLLKNPGILDELQTAYAADRQKKWLAAMKDGIKQNADKIFRSKYSYVAGNPNGNVSVVEFFDYNCGYCRRVFHDVRKLIKNDTNVRVVFKEAPIFGKEQSVDAARVAIAAKKQGKYFELHAALFETPGVKNKETALRVAKDIGLDVEKLKKDMYAKDVDEEIREAIALTNKFGIDGTPFFFVGNQVIPGGPEDLYKQFQDKLANVRKDGCSYC